MSNTQQRAGYSPVEFASIMSLSKSAVYTAVERGDVRAVRIGSRLVIPVTEVDRLLGPAAGDQ